MCPTPMQQLLIVLGVLALLPAAARLLARIGLLPLALYLVCTRLFFPAWAAAHRGLCIALFVLAILLAVGRWLLPVLQNRMLERQVAGQIRMARAFGLEDGQFTLKVCEDGVYCVPDLKE